MGLYRMAAVMHRVQPENLNAGGTWTSLAFSSTKSSADDSYPPGPLLR